MQGIVIYDSHTGNTKKIAEAIHRGMNLTGEKCDIAHLRDVTTQILADYNLIGLGSPVLRNRELHNVTAFIENVLRGVDGKHGFAFCTHGALPGRYLARVVPAMTQMGLTIIGWKDWFGSVYYPFCPKPYFTDGHPDEIDLREAEDFGREMVEHSRRIYAGETGLIPEFPRGREYSDIYEPPGIMPPREVIMNFRKVQAMTEFKVNTEKCKYPKCTLCIDKCPMHSIDFSVSPPLFNIECDKCYLCAQACPQGAIEVDWVMLNNAHLPMVPPLQKSLEIFEARGRFRRLVPLEKIGWNTFFWQRKHPRFKVV